MGREQKHIKVLGLCTYPIEAAATRYRLSQFVGLLKTEGIELDIFPFLTSEQFKHLYDSGGTLKKALNMIGPVFRRLMLAISIKRYDLILVQREAMLFGPAFFEWLCSKVGKIPMILDLDDATYLSYVSPTYGRFGSRFKFFGKVNKLIKRSQLVFCGNPNIARYCESLGTRSEIMPTIVDTSIFTPSAKSDKVTTIGWVGTHSTFPFLEKLFPTFERLSKRFDFKLKIVGAGRQDISLDGVNVENVDWNLERELEDFQSIDIGLYPLFKTDLIADEWLLGKSGFKAIQYLSLGIPFVMSPVGVCAEIGVAGATHYNANSIDEWEVYLNKLLADNQLRKAMGTAGRDYAVEHYNLDKQARSIARAIRDVIEHGESK